MASLLNTQLQERLQQQCGGPVQLVTVREDARNQNLKGVAVCAGRILSFVLEAEQERLRTKPLFELISRARRS
ncbi:MAG: hypothetical protein EBX49_01365 [Synechococcaceae bacterium WB8_1B_136]|nr:hypothetical protein [Synechococcaceae bacterium WB8_1B_136]